MAVNGRCEDEERTPGDSRGRKRQYNFSGGSTLSPGPSLLSKLRRVEGKREAPGDGSNARCL